jgi:hypothetical protein
VTRSKMHGTVPPLPQYLTAWCLVKHRDNFTFTLLFLFRTWNCEVLPSCHWYSKEKQKFTERKVQKWKLLKMSIQASSSLVDFKQFKYYFSGSFLSLLSKLMGVIYSNPPQNLFQCLSLLFSILEVTIPDGLYVARPQGYMKIKLK